MADVIVIGGGIAALSCAVALSDQGLRVTVVEGSARLGGRAGSWNDEHTGDAVDIGPHVVHSEYRNMLALLKRLGTSELLSWQPKKVLVIPDSGRYVVLRHWPLPTPLSLIPGILRAPGLSFTDYISMAGVGWRGMQFGEEQVADLDRVNALDYLRQNRTSERMIDWWWRFAAMVVTNVPLERCSAAALMRIHAQLSGHRNLHFGFAAVPLAHLYIPQSVHAIERAGGRVLTGAPVKEIICSERAEGVVLGDGRRLHASHCVSAVPPGELASLLPSAWRQHPPFDTLGDFEPSPYISCYLWFDRPVMPERFVAQLWSPTRLNYDFYDLSQIRAGWEGRPSVIASNIIYSHRAEGMSDDDIVRATVRELTEFAPAAAVAGLRHYRVHRIPMAIPCPLVGLEHKRPAARSPIPALFLAGDWIQTHLPCSMESAVTSGLLAAEQVLLRHGKQQQLALSQRPYDGLAGLVRRATVRHREKKH